MKPVKVVSAMLISLSLSFIGCAQGLNKSTTGGLTGGALGAGLGAIVGNQAGNTGAGIAIGTTAGVLGGALIGNALDNDDKANAQLGSSIEANQRQLDENARLIDELRKRGADARSSRRGVVVNLPDILFQFDRSELTREAHRTIGEISDVLRSVPDRSLSVEGHTDSVGSVRYNKELSVRRAESVASALVQDGVSSARIRSEGFGEGSPIATNNSDAGRARNRRVEVIIENTASGSRY